MSRLLAAVISIAVVAYPLVFRSNFAINLGVLVLFLAMLGQSWNIAGGFAGQLSFGHAVFFGVGAYASSILQLKLGANPWLGLPAGALGGALAGALIAALSFRAGLRGAYFALITLAFAEAFRILANAVGFTGGGSGCWFRSSRGWRIFSSIASASTTSSRPWQRYRSRSRSGSRARASERASPRSARTRTQRERSASTRSARR